MHAYATMLQSIHVFAQIHVFKHLIIKLKTTLNSLSNPYRLYLGDIIIVL